MARAGRGARRAGGRLLTAVRTPLRPGGQSDAVGRVGQPQHLVRPQHRHRPGQFITPPLLTCPASLTRICICKIEIFGNSTHLAGLCCSPCSRLTRGAVEAGAGRYWAGSVDTRVWRVRLGLFRSCTSSLVSRLVGITDNVLW